MTIANKKRIMLELRPALDGYAGIPQETRLLFRGLSMLKELEVSGLLQTSHRFISPGSALQPQAEAGDVASRFHRYARAIISIDTKLATDQFSVVFRYLQRQRQIWHMAVMALIWPKKGQLALTVFDPVRFEDFIWRRLFSKTLPVNDFATVTTQEFRICSQPWHLLHMAGLTTLKMVSQAIYPLLDTRSIDVFIAQTPFPGRVVANTRLVVRYHDAFPILMPHTIANASRHEATHYHALRCNVQSGAYFSCVSETSRQDLIQLYPELENRSVTIYNMVSHEFFVEQSRRERVDNIVRSRINLLPSKKDSHDHTNEDGFQYLLIVSTIEPRKNHELLLSAWEILRSEVDPTLKLVVVGNEGWNSESVVGKMKFWAELGEIIPLNNLPASDLRVLYRHALATVCPSLAEGFDFAGVEAMCSGGLVIASDIPVHKEIYADAAEYFHPYSVPDMVGSIKKVLFSPDSEMRQNQLRLNAKAVSERFKSETILPKWQSFLQMIAGI